MRLLPTPARLLLLALVALLVFGSCGGVALALRGVNAGKQTALRSILAQNRYLHGRAQQQLRGPARRAEDERIEARTDERLDSLLRREGWLRSKLDNRRRKVERQLRQRSD